MNYLLESFHLTLAIFFKNHYDIGDLAEEEDYFNFLIVSGLEKADFHIKFP